VRADGPRWANGWRPRDPESTIQGTAVEDVYAPGKWNSHLSDDVAAFALAHSGADRQAPPAAGEACRRRRTCRGRSASSPTARASRRCIHRAHVDGGKRRHRRAVCPARWGDERRRGQPCLTFRADWAGFHGRPWRGTEQPSLRGVVALHHPRRHSLRPPFSSVRLNLFSSAA